MARRHFGNVRKLPSARWQGSYWHDGERHTATETFQTKTDALKWLSTKETDIVRGEWIDPGAGKVTFGEFSDQWSDQQGHLRPRTVELYNYLLTSHIRPTFGDRQLSAITNSQVVAWHLKLATARPGTAPKAYRLMASIMRAAVHDGFIARSPVEIKGASKEPTREQPVASVAEVEALAEAVPEGYRAMVMLAAWCGLRFGEAAALRRDRVDLLHGKLRIAETVTELATGERFAGQPKTAAGRRTVAIPPNVIPVFAAHMDTVGLEPTALVFPAPEGGYLSRIHFRQRVWLPALRATGLSYRFHDLRHSALTWAAASGATIAELMHRAGHSTPAAALRYQHATEDRDEAVARAMANLAKPAKIVPLIRSAERHQTTN
ncbi:MAG: tyrosine-type recombinase/integrase [Acidimicrobiales bacterium]